MSELCKFDSSNPQSPKGRRSKPEVSKPELPISELVQPPASNYQISRDQLLRLQASKSRSSTADTSDAIKFFDLKFDSYAVRPVKDSHGNPEICGASSLGLALAIYARVTKEHFFIAKIENLIESLECTQEYIHDSAKCVQHEDVCVDYQQVLWPFAEEMTFAVRRGLEMQNYPGAEDWNVKDARDLIKESLTLGYAKEVISCRSWRATYRAYARAVQNWAQVKGWHERPKAEYWPKDEKGHELWRSMGFVITDPSSNTTKPIWLNASTENPENPLPNSTSNDGRTWKGQEQWGDGGIRIETLFGVQGVHARIAEHVRVEHDMQKLRVEQPEQSTVKEGKKKAVKEGKKKAVT